MSRRARTVRALLFDRDGTLVEDVPYNSEPWKVRLLPSAADAVHLAVEHGWKIGVVTNQSGVARGLITEVQLDEVHRRLRRLLPIDVIEACVHGPADGCECRKPAPGLVRRAAAALGIATEDCVVIGDRTSDVLAAMAAGARGLRIGVPGMEDVLTAVRAVIEWERSAEQDDENDDDQDDGDADVHGRVTPSLGSGRDPSPAAPGR